MSDKLPPELMSLLTPAAYGHPVRAVTLVETHVSWVFLTGELAYKVKRPVRYPFVDLRAADTRARLCTEEIRLNRRFAPDLYLDVCTVTLSDGRARFGGDGQVIEHAVRMHEFPPEAELDRLLASGQIDPKELEQFGRDLARIHDQLPTPQPGQTFGRAEAISAIVRQNFAECLAAAEPLGEVAELRSLEESLFERLRASEALLAARFVAGRVRECHGDLHAGNVARFKGRLVAFDCIEFEPAFRWIDVADEIAFLLVDLDREKRPRHAQAFLSAYLLESGDYQTCRLLALYEAHRALVRAKIASLRAQGTDEQKARDAALDERRAWTRSAARALAPKRGRLVATTGLSGSGKTWLGTRLASELGAVLVRSDVERKRLLGLAELERSNSTQGAGAYTEEVNVRVYEKLARAAQDALEGGFTVVVDATFRTRQERARLRKLADALGAPLTFVRCTAPRAVLLERLARRNAEGADASEADASVLSWQEANCEPISDAEELGVIDADTSRDDVVASVLARLG